jgi:type I restriction enzyme R subunit
MNEAETCRTLVRPKLEAAGWDGGKHFYGEQTAFTDGRIVAPGGKPRRLKKKFSDFLLRYTRDLTLAVVEAKSDRRPAGDGLQQAAPLPLTCSPGHSRKARVPAYEHRRC